MADPDSSISGFRFAPDVRRLVSIKTSPALAVLRGGYAANSTYRLDGSSRCLPSTIQAYFIVKKINKLSKMTGSRVGQVRLRLLYSHARARIRSFGGEGFCMGPTHPLDGQGQGQTMEM